MMGRHRRSLCNYTKIILGLALLACIGESEAQNSGLIWSHSQEVQKRNQNLKINFAKAGLKFRILLSLPFQIFLIGPTDSIY